MPYKDGAGGRRCFRGTVMLPPSTSIWVCILSTNVSSPEISAGSTPPRLATMPSADFCSITSPVTRQCAIGFHRIRSPLSMGSKEPRHLYTRASLVISRSLVKQISPDKDMNFICTAASFTVAVKLRGFDVLCHLASSLRLV